MIITTFNIGLHKITLTKKSVNEAIQDQTIFTGQKLLHPFPFITKVETKGKRTITTNTYDTTFRSNDIEQDILNATSFQIKHDGSCGYIKYDSTHIPYARYDVLRDKKTKEFPKSDFMACEPKPTVSEATHWPHFRNCYTQELSKNSYKWHVEAFNKFMLKNPDIVKKSFTCEFMGKPFNQPRTDPTDVTLIVHGSIVIDIPKECRTPEGFHEILRLMPYAEGIIVYGNNNIYKIRRDLFSDLSWPTETPESLYNSNPDTFSFLKNGGLSSLI